MDWNELRGQEVEALAAALEKAFPTLASLRELAWTKYDQNLDAITEGPTRDRILGLIRAAEAGGWTAKLIEGAHRKNPGNSSLRRFYNEFASSVHRSAGRDELERIVNHSTGFSNVAIWREKLSQVELQVCRIEVNANAEGTGFLVGKDIVLTNYHVIKGWDLATITARFDHKVLPDGSAVSAGTSYHVSAPVLDQSPDSPIDSQYPKLGVPGLHELDFAFLRLAGAPADQMVGGRPRGVVSISDSVPTSGLIFIIQHPCGRPLQLAFDQILGVNENQTRITYKTNTEGGSSGSPCFDTNWKLVALHHSGDPRLDTQAEFNEGIPIRTILKNMKPALRQELGWT